MKEYYPWSKVVFRQSMESYSRGKYTILDIELGGQCNYHCIYCDSPCRDKKCTIDCQQIEKAFKAMEICWVYICGLGEPTATGNLQILINILNLCEKYGAKCSIFTNLSMLNEELEGYIKRGILHILFKYDSSDITKTMSLYGVPSVNRQIFNIEKIKGLANQQTPYANIAASIVPTRINREDIIKVVKDCLHHKIYPLIADLENSGDAQDYYQQLALSTQELLGIKEEVNELIGDVYYIPVCPAVISGIHIRYDGKVTVDEHTGLSCHWFWLEEPKTHIIGDFNIENCETIVEKIEAYRNKRRDFVKQLLTNSNNFVFGGCGGDAVYLLNEYAKTFEGKA